MDFQALGLSPISTEGKWSAVRHHRNRLLAECDWTQLPDVALTVDEKQAWANYRQALRDVTEAVTSPDDVVFPAAPGEL